MNSKLICCTLLSPSSSVRMHKIDTVTIHCMAGNGTVEACGKRFLDPALKASSNYGIGSDGRIGLYVPENRRSWASSNRENDDRAVTIEVANDGGAPDWHVSDRAYAALIDLLTDICQRNGIPRLLWEADRSLIGQTDRQNMTVHRWFAAKACPGEWLYQHHYEIAAEVNRRLEEERMIRYERTSDILTDPSLSAGTARQFHGIVDLLMTAGIIAGDGSDPNGNRDIVDLSKDMVRMLVFNYRAGMYDAAIRTAGLNPEAWR